MAFIWEYDKLLIWKWNEVKCSKISIQMIILQNCVHTTIQSPVGQGWPRKGLAWGEVAHISELRQSAEQIQPVYCCDMNHEAFLNTPLSSSSPSSSWRSSRFNRSRKWDFTGLLDCVRHKWGVSTAAPGVLAPVYLHDTILIICSCSSKSCVDFSFFAMCFIYCHWFGFSNVLRTVASVIALTLNHLRHSPGSLMFGCSRRLHVWKTKFISLSWFEKKRVCGLCEFLKRQRWHLWLFAQDSYTDLEKHWKMNLLISLVIGDCQFSLAWLCTQLVDFFFLKKGENNEKF